MREWWGRSPTIGRRELWLVILASSAVAIVQFLPLVANLGSDIPLDLGDPLAQAWQVAWGGHALLHQPLHFWQANQFWPLPDSLAFSDALIGYAPTGMIGIGPVAAVARYDLLFLFAFALALVGAYLLAREVGVPPWAAAVAGAAFAYSPWRLEQGGHMHVISSGGIPLALFLLLRGYRRQSPWLILAGWAVAAWQCSLGFALGLQLDYLLLVLAVIGLIAWHRSGRPRPPAAVVRATAIGAVFFVAASVLLALPYLRVLHDHPEAKRTIDVLFKYSPPPKAFLNAPISSLVWGELTEPFRSLGNGNAEKTLFPGLVICLLALFGLGWRRWPRALRVGLGVSVVVLVVLSLGVHESGLGRYMPYRFVYEFLPGWEGIRTPGRLQTLTSLALALLAAAGSVRLATWVVRRWAPIKPAAVCIALTLLVLVEGSGAIYPHPRAPIAPSGLAGLPAPLLQLPYNPAANRRYLLWSTAGFPEMVNGRTSFEPTLPGRIAAAAEGFPSAESILRLRGFGVRTVVVHADLEPFAVGRAARLRPIPVGSGVTREQRGSLVVFRLPAGT